MMLEQLVYVSTSTDRLRSVLDVSDILEEAVRHNPANDITGVLAFTETRFVQLLEGTHGSLDVLLLKLMIDPRHSDLIVIDRLPIRNRSFAAWSMLAPVFTPSGHGRLENLLAEPTLPVEDFRLLLLEMIAEQSEAVRAHFPDDAKSQGPLSQISE